MDRWIVIIGVAILGCVPQSLTAKVPEMGGPRRFDLECRGQAKLVVDQYIPFHHSGMPGMDDIKQRSVRKHVIIDMITMKFLEKPQPYSGSPPKKISSYDRDFGLLMLENESGLARRWAIRLDNYKSTAVTEYSSGEIWVEHMTCRAAPFSGFD